MKHLRSTRPGGLLLAVLLGLFLTSSAQAANIIVVNGDGVNEGFNDTTPWTPRGGNPANTLGQARLNAFQHAADIWGDILVSSVSIEVLAQMNPLFCNASSATLGSAGTTSVHWDFLNAPVAGVLYPQALANSIAGSDLNTNGTIPQDIQAQFNSAIDNNDACLAGAEWYYGYDGNPPPGDFDFITVVLHEIAHGLGFQTFHDLDTGEPFLGRIDTFMNFLESVNVTPSDYPSMTDNQRSIANRSDPNLRWRGGNVTYIVARDPLNGGMNGNYVRMHAPTSLVPGSSVAHWSTSVTPNEPMEPVYTGAEHNPRLAKFLMQDIGWTLNASVPVAFPEVLAMEKGAAVELRWEYAGSSALQGFRIYRRDGDHAPELALQGVDPLDAQSRSYLDFGVEPGRSYVYSVAAIGPDGRELRSPEARAELQVRRSTLSQNHPNPFNPKTEISYRLAEGGPVLLTVYDLKGRAVQTLVNERQDAGAYTVPWDGRDAEGKVAAAGTYFYRFIAQDAQEVRRMVLLK